MIILSSSRMPATFPMDQNQEVGEIKQKGKNQLPENTTEKWKQLKYDLVKEPKYSLVLREICANGQYFQSKIDKITNIFKEGK